MTEAMTGIFILLMISVIAAFFAFALIRTFVLACLAAACAAAVLFQVIDYFHVGYLDSFFLIAAAVSFFLAYGIAALVGFMIRTYQ